jgi:predicted AAA+ superfamily ATPase
MYITRKLEVVMDRLVRQYPVVTVTGPRQSGKTTLCRKLFPEYNYVSLEKPDIRRRAQNDPNGFLEDLKERAIIDEVQRVPELFSYIQVIVDEAQIPGQFILTGSAQFELFEKIGQSLAGRTTLLKLLPFSFGEIYKSDDTISIDDVLFKGFYPRIFDQELNPSEALSHYFSTYIERDLRSIINIKDLSRFETFIRLCSGRTGQILNFNALANEAGINHNTASSWISVLEASYLVFRLKPHYNNLNKRLVKAPKLYFIDCGLACNLLDMQNPGHLANHPLKGSLFETFIVSEILKQQLNRSLRPNLYYWRDNVGHEIDLILDFGTTVLPIEIKSGKTITSDFFKNLDYYRKLNSSSAKALLIYGGDESYIEKNTWILSYKKIGLLENIDYNLEIPL